VPISRIVIGLGRSIRIPIWIVVRAVAVVATPIRAAFCPTMNARNAHWSERTPDHRGGGVTGQRHISLGREAKRQGSCTQNAGEEGSRTNSYCFRHCDLLSTPPPKKIITPQVEVALTHINKRCD